jgi:orotate phosphoribosyltransferase
VDQELLKRVYEAAFTTAVERPYLRPADGGHWRASRWALDLRIPLARSSLLMPVASEMAQVLSDLNVKQLAGRGFGGFPLVGAITALGPDFRSGMIRNSPKRFGFQTLIEGDLDPSEEVAIVDDLLSSGRSAATTVHSLRLNGFTVRTVLAVFRYGWKHPERLLQPLNVSTIALGTLEHKSP